MASMLCPALIGRRGELRALTACLDRAGQGHGRTVFITGDAGVGKSRLVRELSALAAEHGFQVLSGRAAQSTVPVPFRPITEALIGAARAGVVPDSPGIAAYRPALGSLVPEWSRPGDGDCEMSAVILGEALLRLLTVPGRKGGLLVLEDLHWADPETLAIVEYLADNLAVEPMLCVATLRDSASSGSLGLLQSACARRVATRIDVHRLSPHAVEQMAAACLDSEAVPRAVTRLLRDCDGLPFAVEEVLAAAVSSGELVRGKTGWQLSDAFTTGVPASIVDSVQSRLAALGPRVADVIVCAAVLGRQFDWTLLPSVADVTETEALAALQRAYEVQLIEPAESGSVLLRFRHSLTRDAIMSGRLPIELASRSASAAAAIENAKPGLPGAWCELAAELYIAAGRPVQAARLLLVAGRRAVRHGALNSAAASLRDARNLLPTAPGTEPLLADEIDEALVEALALAGDFEQLTPLAEDLIARLNAAGADPRREALIRIKTARSRPEDNPAAAAAHLSAARAIADRLDDQELTSRIDAAGARCALDAGDLDRAGELARRSLAAAGAARMSGWAAEVAFESLAVIGRGERPSDISAARTAFERAYQIAEREGSAFRRIRALHELGTIDMLANGDTSRLSELRETTRRAGMISTATVIDLQLANIWSLGTDLTRAQVAAQQCEQTASQIGADRVAAMAISVQAVISGIRADRQATELAAERAERVLPGDPDVLFATWGQARVVCSLFLDDLPRALRESRKGMSYVRQPVPTELRRAAGFYSPLQAPLTAPRRAWGLYALLQTICADDGRTAISEANAAGAAMSWNLGCLAYAEAVLEGRNGHPDRAAVLAEEGRERFAAFATRWNHLARRLIAPAALHDGWGQPVAWLNEAAGEFAASGHDRLASACRGILRRAGERVPRAGRGAAHVPAQMRRLGVTSREMDVFLLVAQGISNADIARRLFISPKTVETHIASLVAKTGQASRRELVAHAAGLARTNLPRD